MEAHPRTMRNRGRNISHIYFPGRGLSTVGIAGTAKRIGLSQEKRTGH